MCKFKICIETNAGNSKFVSLNASIQHIVPRTKIYFVVILVLAAVAIYAKLFSAQFISWDDGDVLLNNKDVHQFSLKAFFTSYYVGNYAPVSMIGFAVDWLLFRGKAMGHHAMSLLFHVMNTLLVYHLINIILKDNWKAVVCALIFCFHPLQVETVAWVSAKNNLTYSFFFLLGLIYYTKYITARISKFYIFTLLFFALSVLSKPSAICFPLVMVLFDYLMKRQTSLKSLILNKVPFFIVALILGLATIYTRTEDKFINQNHAFAIHERVGYAGFALLQYIYKFLVPVNLSVIYPYPQNKMQSIILGYGVLLFLIFVLYRLFKKSKLVFFALGFFIANLILVLQFLPFGEVLTADRYMYLPIIGLSIVLVSVFPPNAKALKIIAVSLTLIFGSLTFIRAGVWKNSISLYSDILKKYPHSFVALNSLGAEYMLNKNYDLGLRYFNAAIAENTEYYKGYYNRGLLYAQTNRMTNALEDFNMAIKLKQYPKAYVARANVYYTLKDYPKAIQDAEFVLNNEPQNLRALYVIANCYDDLNQLSEALTFYNKLIYFSSDTPLYLLRRAIVYGKMRNFDACLNDLNEAIRLDPEFAEPYYWKGVAKVNLKQNPCPDFHTAMRLGFEGAGQAQATYCK
jgi:tetratricopeptide (TPR) repeat protein